MPTVSPKQCVEVTYEKLDSCPFKGKPNIYFQIVYIISGSGNLSLNGNRIKYTADGLYLFTPNDKHHFEIEHTTEFLLVRINSAFIREYRWKSIDHVETILHHASHLTGCIMKSESDRYLVKRIVESLQHALVTKDDYNVDLIFHLVNTLVVIAARNINKVRPSKLPVHADSKIQEIITYIQSNINSPELLKASTIGKEFGISETYLGSYFKHQTGETLQHYMSNYKLRLIEHRLKFSDMRINEIALEFGFTDESHLNKFFKKHRTISLTEFRKAHTNVMSPVIPMVPGTARKRQHANA